MNINILFHAAFSFMTLKVETKLSG